MEIKLREIVSSTEALDRLFSGRARAKEGFQLALIRRKISPILEEHRKMRLELFKDLGHRDMTQASQWNFWQETGEKDPNGRPVREFDHDAYDRFEEDYSEMLDADVTIDFEIDITTIDKAKIDPPLTPDELAALWWLIKDFRELEAKED
jgi:hypothetical protein